MLILTMSAPHDHIRHKRVISVYFDFWSRLVSKIVSKSGQHFARSQLKISKDISHSWNRNKNESGAKVYTVHAKILQPQNCSQVWKVALVYELYIALR